MIYINVVVEDPLSEAVARALLKQSKQEYQVNSCLGKCGKEYIRTKLRGFNGAAKGIAPRHGDTRSVGPDYNYLLIEFVERRWNARVAAKRSDSLRRALRRLDMFQPTQTAHRAAPSRQRYRQGPGSI